MSRRGFLATGVLAAWAGGLALLFARELNPSLATRLADVALRVTPITTYYVVERDGQHVGFASIAFDTVPRALQVTEYLVTDGSGGRSTDQLTVRLSRGLAFRDLEWTRASGADSVRMTARAADSLLVVQRAGAADTLPLTEPAFAGAIAPAVSVLLDSPRPGSSVALSTIDPAAGRIGPRALRVAAESLFVVVDSAVADSSGRWFAVHKDTVRAWRLVADSAPRLDAWVDAQGLIVEANRDDGLVVRRTAFELAFENWRLANPGKAVAASAASGVVAGTLLASGASRPAGATDTLVIQLGDGVPRDWVSQIGRGWRSGNSVTLGRTPPDRLRSRYTLPGPERWRRVFQRELARGTTMESDDPAIARLSSRLANGEKDPSIVVQRVIRWVHDSLRAESGLEPVTAAGALSRRSGDAREFALLTAALLRAAGVPANPVTGLLEHNGRFYLHTWTEAYVGRWVPVDAMLGQWPADASHIQFVSGSADLGPDLSRVLSRLQLRVVRAVPAR